MAMAAPLPDSLADLAARQRGILTRRQALAAGLTDDMIRARLDSGSWQRLHTGVYAEFSGQPERAATLWAAVLRGGPGAALSYQTAAELDRLTDRPSALIHLTVPSARKVMPISGIVLHARRDVLNATHPSRLPPRLRIEETVLDLADQSNDGWGAVGWVTAALGRRLTTQELLGEALSRRARSRWRQDLTLALSPELAGVHSVLEYRYVRDVESAHWLPKGTRQAQAGRRGQREYRDVLYEEFGLVVELDGRAAHPDERRWKDIHRDNFAATAGLVTLRYSNWDVRSSPCLVAAQVAGTLQTRGWQGRPRPCSESCLLRRPCS